MGCLFQGDIQLTGFRSSGNRWEILRGLRGQCKAGKLAQLPLRQMCEIFSALLMLEFFDTHEDFLSVLLLSLSFHSFSISVSCTYINFWSLTYSCFLSLSPFQSHPPTSLSLSLSLSFSLSLLLSLSFCLSLNLMQTCVAHLSLSSLSPLSLLLSPPP